MQKSAEVLVEITRADLIESQHSGHAVILNEDGSIDKTIGDPFAPYFPRSAIKLAQATAALESGAKLADEALSISCASHSGEEIHRSLVKKMLSEIDLDETFLQCPPDYPFGAEAKIDYIAKGLKPESITMNCSGKHAGMLNACVQNNWNVKTYLEMNHPLQKNIHATIENLAEEKIFKSTFDGCGAPLHAISLVGLAKIAHNAVKALPSDPQRKVVDAARNFPIINSGNNRDVAKFMQSVPGFFTKEGAEGVHVGALADGRSFAVKFEDGSMRPRPSFVVEVLKYWGIEENILNKLSELAQSDVLGGGKPVGFMRALPIER